MLPLDQAEELFSSDAGPEAAAFLRLITELGRPDADDQHLGLIVAATIRTDRYELMQSAPELAGLTSEVFDDLKPMPPNQFREVITGPAARASAGGQRLSFAPVLVNRLLEEAAEGGDALPLLALTLRRLYDRYGDTGDITLADYEAMGGMRRVVQNVVDEVLSAEPEQRARQLAELRAAFIPWLATIADNDEPVRRVTRWSDLPEASRPLIDAFVENGCWSRTSAAARWSSRLRWKACCANGTTWPAGCAINVTTSKPPARLNTTPRRGTPPTAAPTGC